MLLRALAAIVASLSLADCASPGPPPRDAGVDATEAGSPTPSDRLVDTLRGRHVLWVGAHPDDETTIAPLFAELCLERGSRCSMLVATRGEAGGCAIAGGCMPNLATVRDAEMRAAASLYGAALIAWDLRDGTASGPEAVVANWSAAVGSNEALVERMKTTLQRLAPDAIITFDPRHGTTCHPDHRAISSLLLVAHQQLAPPRPTLLFAQVRLDIAPMERTIGYVRAVDDPWTIAFDAQRPVPSVGGTAWDALIENLRAHPSQFGPTRVAGFSAAVPEQRRVFVLPLDTADLGDARYFLCR